MGKILCICGAGFFPFLFVDFFCGFCYNTRMTAFDLSDSDCAAFGVAGNFTGHLEQAGEARDFSAIEAEAGAPKAVFPTFIPGNDSVTPAFLHVFPFDSEKIIFPRGEEKIQIEAECGILYDADWKKSELAGLRPLAFCASNDVSIRKKTSQGMIIKISEKKNWGVSTKGSGNMINLSGEGDFFAGAASAASRGNEEAWAFMSRYRICSYLERGGRLSEYGENSSVRSYSYFYEKLDGWLLQKFNLQKNEGPAENIHSYLEAAGFPQRIFVSVGATRYTAFGEHNFLQDGDFSIVCLYPEDKYERGCIEEILVSGGKIPDDISLLRQKVIL